MSGTNVELKPSEWPVAAQQRLLKDLGRCVECGVEANLFNTGQCIECWGLEFLTDDELTTGNTERLNRA